MWKYHSWVRDLGSLGIPFDRKSNARRNYPHFSSLQIERKKKKKRKEKKEKKKTCRWMDGWKEGRKEGRKKERKKKETNFQKPGTCLSRESIRMPMPRR